MGENIEKDSVGIVQPQNFVFGATDDTALKLDCGRRLKNVNIRYETYGTLSPEKDNAILIEHALTGDAHLAGKHSESDKKSGWWDDTVGPGKPFDTNKFFIVCSNVLGGCSGSTGPGSIDPDTGEPYNMKFPVITIGDMVRAQKALMDHLGIPHWLAVAGGSFGGLQALQWALDYPDHVKSALIIAASARISPQSIAFDWVGRKAIMSDPQFLDGNYVEQPHSGLATARMLAHITYLSDETMHRKFGRRLQDSETYSFDFGKDFAVESYMIHQGTKFVERFDANAYLFITRAMDYFDIAEGTGGDIAKALEKAKFPFLVVSISSDWLFPAYQSRELTKALLKNGTPVTYCNIQSGYGHDAFLLETEKMGLLIRHFLDNRFAERNEK